jgi:hypothetical protein
LSECAGVSSPRVAARRRVAAYGQAEQGNLLIAIVALPGDRTLPIATLDPRKVKAAERDERPDDR